MWVSGFWCQQKNTSKKANMRQEQSHSVVDTPLADIPLDVMAPSTMHLILGFTKKIYKVSYWNCVCGSKHWRNNKPKKQHTTSNKLSRRLATVLTGAMCSWWANLKVAVEGKKAETGKIVTDTGKATRHCKGQAQKVSGVLGGGDVCTEIQL